MKKNVIAVMLSLVMAVGNVGTVPVFAAEEGSTTEADSEAEETETSVEIVEEEESEVITEPDDVNKEQSSDDEETTQSDNTQNPGNDNSATETSQDSEESLESDEEQPDDEEDTSVSDEADPAYADSWDNYDYEPEKVEFNGNYYYFRNCAMKNSYGFDLAEEWCEQEGGHLVTINSPEEETFIRSEIKKIDVLYGFWIGAYRNNTSESWKWINGEKWNYPGTNGSGTSNWPSNAIRIAYYENGRVIGNSTLDDTNGFICEWEDEKDISKASVTLKDAFQDDVGNNCYEYTGAQIKPGILEVRLGDKTLVNGTDYTATYGTNLSYGEATVTVKGKGDYKGELVVKFLIVPKKITGLKGNNKLSKDAIAYTNYRRGLDLIWDQQIGDGILYEIQYSKTADFNEKETVTVSENKYSDLEKPLERKTDYYVRVRANLKVNGKAINGQWSDTLTVKSGGQILASEMWALRNDSTSYTDFRFTKKEINNVFGSTAGQSVFDYMCSFISKDKYGEKYGKDWIQAGLCNGLVNTGIAYYEYGVPEFGSYPKKISESNYKTAGSSKFNINWLDCVKYAQIAQCAVNPQEELQIIRYDLNCFYDAVKKCEKGEGPPVTIGYGRTLHGGHELLAIGISKESDSEIDIEVYDVNSVQGDEAVPRNLHLKKVGGLIYEWSYVHVKTYDPKTGEIGETEKITGNIYDNPGVEGAPYFHYNTTQAYFDSQILDEINRNGHVEIQPGETDKVKEALEIENWFDDNNISLQNTLKTKDAIEWLLYQDDNTNNSGNEFHAYWISGNDIQLSAVPKDVSLSLASKLHYMKLHVPDISDVYMQVPDDKASVVKVTPEESNTFEITLIDGEGRPSTYTEKTVIKADAVGNQELAITQDGDQVYFHGADSISITRISGNEDDNGSIDPELRLDISADTDPAVHYRFTQENNTARIIGDLDGNGKYETIITENEIYNDGPAIIDSGTCGENITWMLDEYGVLTISGKGDMPSYEFSEILYEEGEEGLENLPWDPRFDDPFNPDDSPLDYIAPWFFIRDDIQEIVVKDGVTDVGSNAFAYCENCRKVTLAKSVKSISSDAFQYCTSLEEFSWHENIETIGFGAFWGCASLDNVVIPDNVRFIGNYAFAYCDKLKNVTLGQGSNYDSGGMFKACKSLEQIVIPDGEEKIVGNMFEDCSSLKKIVLPESLTSIGFKAFKGCSGLTDIIIPESVTSIGGYAFTDCSSLKSLTIPDGVTNIDNSAFGSSFYWGADSSVILTQNPYVKEYCKENNYVYFDKAAPSITKLASYNGSDIRVYYEKRDFASGYQIKYADNKNMTNAKSVMIKDNKASSKVISGFINGKTYYVQIQTYIKTGNASYWSKWSSKKSVKIEQTPYPTNVAKLSTYIGSHIKVDWTKTAGASGYHIKYADNSSMTGAKEVMVKGNSTFTKTLTGLKNGKTYYVKIQTYRTVSGKTYWSSWSPAKSIKVDQKPYGSSISKLTNPSNKAMKIIWDKAPSVTGYHIQYSTNSNMTGVKDITINNKDTLSKTVTGLTKGKTYYVRIQTFRKVSGKTYWSSWSKAKQIKITK